MMVVEQFSTLKGLSLSQLENQDRVFISFPLLMSFMDSHLSVELLVYILGSNEAPWLVGHLPLQISSNVSLDSTLSYSYIGQHMPFVKV
jgi:hypothetical protein